MAEKHHAPMPSMQGPAVYEIRVRGHLSRKWSDQLGGLQITETLGSDGKAETILIGRLSDQAALAGTLNTLYELHLPVVSVECLDNRDPEEGPAGG